MTLCAACSQQLSGDAVAVGVCGHHPVAYDIDWHISNRVMCDLLHRGVEPRRLPASDRADDLGIYGDAA